MRTLGIDLSADPAKTGACEVDWDAGSVTLLRRPTGDEELVDACLRVDLVAIDVPLGWPDEFVEALVAHRDRSEWPPLAASPPGDRRPLRFRRTDLFAQEQGARPLSVSSDLIGVAAMRGARLQGLLALAGLAVDRSGTTGRVLEVYPAAALRIWGFVSSGYKGRANLAVCRDLVASVTEACGNLGSAAAECLDGCDDDALDAFVCALVARAAAMGHTTTPGPQDMGVARREGWIHLPTADLSAIVATG